MAAKIAVLQPYQQLSDIPTEYVRKCVAQMLVRKCYADEIHSHLIRRRKINQTRPRTEMPALSEMRYIPSTLPLAEIENVTASLPETIGVTLSRRCLVRVANHFAAQ